jgi:hypothetical protein
VRPAGELVNIPPCSGNATVATSVQQARAKCNRTTYTCQAGDFPAL